MTILLSIGALVLAFVCIITVLVILMQRPSANAGMGAALGGGAAETAFGGEAGNVLTKMTNIFIIIFLVLSLGLFLGYKRTKPANDTPAGKGDSLIKDLSKSETPAAPAIAPAPAVKPEAPATTAPAPAATTTAPAAGDANLKDIAPYQPAAIAPTTAPAPTTTPAAPATETPAAK